MPRSRWILHIQAQFWRLLMDLGMFSHRLAPPRPQQPAFMKTIKSTIGKKQGQIYLYFYVPPQYERQGKAFKAKRDHEHNIDAGAIRTAVHQHTCSSGRAAQTARPCTQCTQSTQAEYSYPVVINFHGGGFTLGAPTDDARWCTTVVDECEAVVVSVGYRLAPEYPFPYAVEDGVDAIIWVHKHAVELGN